MTPLARATCVTCVAFLLGAVGCAGGLGDRAVESLATVATLRSGTMSELRAQRGLGPFRRYEVAPDVLLEAVAAAATHARGRGNRPVKAIFTSRRRGEVVAKERAPGDADSTGYAKPFVSAMLAVVHGIPGEPHAARLEIHETHSGPFHVGAVRWRGDMPGWIEGELARRAPTAMPAGAGMPDAPDVPAAPDDADGGATSSR